MSVLQLAAEARCAGVAGLTEGHEEAQNGHIAQGLMALSARPSAPPHPIPRCTGRRLADAEVAAAGEDTSLAESVDALFHRAVVRASGNELLVEVYDYLGTALASSLGGLPWDAAGAEEHAGLHRRLVDAIEARDESGARAAAAAIVRLTRDHESQAPRAEEEQEGQ